MEQYQVTGMSCAACSARVEKAVSGVPGVTSCSVSLLTNSMGVEGTASPAEIIRAVENAGYGAKPKNAAQKNETGGAPSWADAEALKDHETPKLKKRLWLSVPILLILMYFSMGHGMWGWPAPKAFDNHVFLGLFELLNDVGGVGRPFVQQEKDAILQHSFPHLRFSVFRIHIDTFIM